MKKSPIILLFKSHIDTYTRKDGTVVQAHDDKRQAAAKDWRDEENWHSRMQGKMKTHSEAELRYIIKDAREAAKLAYERGNDKKGGQYEDEAHYAAQELHKRGEGVREAKAKYDAEQVQPKAHPNGKHQVGDSVFFPHPDKPGKNALGKYAGHRGGKSVIKHGDKEIDVDHDQVKPARGIPKKADPIATSAAAHEFRKWSKNAD